MPYIKDDKKDEAVRHIEPLDAGELTWTLYIICRDYFLREGRFQQIADVRAALVSTGHELDRRYFDSYEDEKREENGEA